MTTATATGYEVVVGLEVHAQLRTRSKMFCDCRSDYFAAAANTRACAVCLGMPGVLPVINQQAVDLTIRSGLAFGCSIPEHSKFDRKNYPYPDLMKGYQISQYDEPLCVGGSVEIEVEGERRKIALERIHLEEDTARLLHRDDDGGYSLLDVNRSGVPLMENRLHARHALLRGGRRLPAQGAPDAALPGGVRRRHGEGLLPRRRQRLAAPAWCGARVQGRESRT